MIRMSLDKETILPCDRASQEVSVKASPVLQAGVTQSEKQKPTKTHPLRPKNGLQPANNTQAPPTGPSHRVGKRRYSMGVGLKGLAKRRRRANSDGQSEPVLPTNFLLGGNIFDPLNLNSLLDEEVNRLTNQETPKCSPLPTRGGDPVEILVPRDITDPLNLKGGEEEKGGGALLLSPLKNRRRHRNRHQGGGEGQKETKTGAAVPLLTREGSVPASPLPCELNTSITCRDDIAPPPVLPRRHTHPPIKTHNHGDNRQRRRRRTTSMKSSESTTNADTPAVITHPTRFETPLVGGAKASRSGGLRPRSSYAPMKKTKDRHRYQYGNHNRHYGYHGFYGDKWEGRIGPSEDPRLGLLKADWFKDKLVLDIGCGAGHVALEIAKRFRPKHILGLDRDRHLVHAARQNIRHFLSHDLAVAERCAGRTERGGDGETVNVEKTDEQMEVKEPATPSPAPLSFPLSFRVCRGPLAASALLCNTAAFPGNITFIAGDYVSEQEVWPGRGQYDVIMCLGVTKWVQLQSGDAGVVRLFKRAYQSLLPGGIFILESQPWSSYSHSKRASETTYRNYRNLRLKPEKFTSHLTEQTGFTSYRLLTHTGVLRPVYLFHKGSSHRK